MSTPIECRVGGILFHSTLEALTNVLDSFFAVALNESWNKSTTKVLSIERDGTHFQYILDFLRYGHLPRDSAGRCNIPQDILEAISIEAEFYGLVALVEEIHQLLKSKGNGMKYLISHFSLNSSPDSGSVTIAEYETREQALKVYEEFKKDQTSLPYVDKIFDFSENDDDLGDIDDLESIVDKYQSIVIEERSDPDTGLEKKEVFQEGNWKRPQGIQFLGIPVNKQGLAVVYECELRSNPINRSYYW